MTSLRLCTGAYAVGVDASPPASTQPASAAPVPPSAAPLDVDEARAPDSDNADDDDDGAAAADQPEKQNQEAKMAQAADGASATITQAEKKPTPGANASGPLATPETPERFAAPAPHTGERSWAQAGETEPDVSTVMPGPAGCTTPPAPAHDSEGSDTQSADSRGGSPLHEQKPRQVTASKSRLLAFRSFSRDKKASKPGGVAAADDTSSPERRKAERKRFWK